MPEALRRFGQRHSVYLVHVLSLLAPGKPLPSFKSDQLKPKEVAGWSSDELKLLIEEGRRQSDRQTADLQALRGRAQWLFTVGAAALGALAASRPGGPVSPVWLLGMAALVYGVAGAAAIVVVRADFQQIHAAVLSALPKPVDLELARAYSRMMAEGENTFATRLTVFRQAVVWCLCGGYVGLLAALLAG